MSAVHEWTEYSPVWLFEAEECQQAAYVMCMHTSTSFFFFFILIPNYICNLFKNIQQMVCGSGRGEEHPAVLLHRTSTSDSLYIYVPI
jgi:hypothetical protein